MAAIEAISIGGSGLGQAAGKAGAGAASGFDLLFAVSSEAAVATAVGSQELGPICLTPIVPTAAPDGAGLAEIEQFLGLQPKAALPAALADTTAPPAVLADTTAPPAALADTAVLPEPFVAVSPPPALAFEVASLPALPIVFPKKITAIAPELGMALASETGEATEELSAQLPEALADPDAKQAAGVAAALLIAAPEKAPAEALRPHGPEAKPAPPRPPLAPQIQPAKAKPSRAEPLVEQAQEPESPALAPLDLARPVARLKLDLLPGKPLAPLGAEGPPAMAALAKDQPAAEGAQGLPHETDLPAAAPQEGEADPRQPAGSKGPQSLPLAATAFEPLQSSPLKPAAAMSSAPILAQLRQTLDTRDAAWRERLVDQVVGGSKESTQSITLMLRPKSLGDMQLQIEIGAVDTSVRIVTETASAARLMMANEDLLSQLMDQSGIRLASLTAQSMGQAGFSGQSLAQNSGGQGGRESAGLRKERVRGAEANGAKQEPSVTRGDTSKSSINLMA